MVMDEYDSTQADTRLIFGDQGAGKTNTAVATVVDDCFINVTRVINPITGEWRKACPLNDKEIELLESKGVSYSHLKHMKIFSNDGKSSKILAKPEGWVIDSPIKVFSNFHFYGIRHKYIDETFLIENINESILSNAWLVLDEGFLTDKQDTMSRPNKMVAKFGAQGRRKKLHTIIISQYADMVNSRFIRFATTKVLCKYDKFTKYISLDVIGSSDFMQSGNFKASNYWKFFRHDETVNISQHSIDNYMADVYKKR
jgi:hypothetical protein